MLQPAADEIDSLLLGARLEEAVAAALSALPALAPEPPPRMACAALAVAGEDRGLGAALPPELLQCTTFSEIRWQLEILPEGPKSHDLLAAGVLLSWRGDPSASLPLLREAHDRAIHEGKPHLAVAARERLAHHALLFGEINEARIAIDEALRLSAAHGLLPWQRLCEARAAYLAVELEDADAAAALVSDDVQNPEDPSIALFAPAGVRLAALAGDNGLMARWSSPVILDIALRASAERYASAAAAACAFAAADESAVSTQMATAMRRALSMVTSPARSVEFLSVVARCAPVDEARLAVNLLRSVFSPERRYVKAHYLLSRAHLSLRGDDRTRAIEFASDAARAFDAIGMRYWTNEAMSLLVRDNESRPQLRRRPAAAHLTRRERQVAYLIGRGASNREVARTLQISEHTVERHVSSILARLGLRSRWQILDAGVAENEH